jgi:hypothetical protein
MASATEEINVAPALSHIGIVYRTRDGAHAGTRRLVPTVSSPVDSSACLLYCPVTEEGLLQPRNQGVKRSTSRFTSRQVAINKYQQVSGIMLGYAGPQDRLAHIPPHTYTLSKQHQPSASSLHSSVEILLQRLQAVSALRLAVASHLRI